MKIHARPDAPRPPAPILRVDVAPTRRAGGEALASTATLALTGVLIGASVPAARAATGAGVASLSWALASVTTASLWLIAGTSLARSRPPFTRTHLGYYGAVGLFSVALPQLALFTAVPAVGASVASLAYVLPPLFTLSLAALTGTERATPRRALGVAVGLAGTLAVVLPRGVLPDAVSPWQLVLVVLSPASIAIGNVLRARLWPAGSEALPNAAGSTSAGALWLALFALLGDAGSPDAARAFGGLAPLLVAQGGATAAAMVLFFWLQRTAGPVFTSQVGYVATAAGVAGGAVWFDEHVSPWLLVAAALVALGIAIARDTTPPGQGGAPRPTDTERGEAGDLLARPAPSAGR